MDNYARLRSLGFAVVLPALGFDLGLFKLRKNGQEYYGPCPVHQPEKNTTSFSYISDGRWFCFSCNAKGAGSIDLVKAVKQCGFKEAVAFLEPLVDAKTKEKTPQEKSPVLGENLAPGELKPFTGKYDKYAVPCDWLKLRIPDETITSRYGVFQYFNPARKSAYSGRVMLPVKDVEGILYGYLGRQVPDTSDKSHSDPSQTNIPKYLFPPNLPKSRFLFGAHELDTFGQLPLRVVHLVESPFCVMKFASLGIPAVSPFGWSVSEEQIQILLGLTKGVIYIPDTNKRQSAHEVVALLSQRLWTRFPPLPEPVADPEHLSLEQIQTL